MANLKQTNFTESLIRRNTPRVSYQEDTSNPVGGVMGIDVESFPFSWYSAEIITATSGTRRFRIQYQTTSVETFEVWFSKRRNGSTYDNWSIFYHFAHKQPGDNDFRIRTDTELSRSGGFESGRLTYFGFTTPSQIDEPDTGGRNNWAAHNFDYNSRGGGARIQVMCMVTTTNTRRAPYIYWIPELSS